MAVSGLQFDSSWMYPKKLTQKEKENFAKEGFLRLDKIKEMIE